MPNRRDALHQYYKQRREPRGLLLEKAAATDRFAFKGTATKLSIVVRTDLNGYSGWTRDKTIAERVLLLDDFFSTVVPSVENYGGVFFRDEGDCIVSVFSDYTGTGATFEKAERFCMVATGQKYGAALLTCKSALACGTLAFFQKAHEVGTDDWSAEGEPFVRVHRLEDALDKSQQIVFFASDYDTHFAKTNWSSTGGGRWFERRKQLQVAGLGLPGGWADTVVLEYHE